jgi:anti-sigma regulatory factor (Ser/Thr protein kinase)
MLEGVQLTRLGRHEVKQSVDVFALRRAVRRDAVALGFSARDAEELVLVVSELGTNIIKYGRHGFITADEVDDPVRGVGLVLEARDFGPPFHDFSLALLDRHDDRGPILPDGRSITKGLGVGLGTVVRLTHGVEHQPLDDGKIVRAVRFVRRERR